MMIQPMLVSVEDSPEDDLIRAAAAGDRAAFGRLYAIYARMVHGILLARVPPSAADDLAQDVFLSALTRLRGLRTAAAFRGWLAAIARNRAADYFRETRRDAPFDESAGRRPTSAPHAEALMILDTIRGLPEAYRETLVLRLVEGMTGPEIAQQTGLTPDSVRVNLCRGMKMLRELLGGSE